MQKGVSFEPAAEAAGYITLRSALAAALLPPFCGVVGDGQRSEDLDLVAEGGLVDGAGVVGGGAHASFFCLPLVPSRVARLESVLAVHRAEG